MSVNYGVPAAGGAGYTPPGRVNFGWISEAFELFKANAGAWILACLMLYIVPSLVGGIIGRIFGAMSAMHQTSGPQSSGHPPFGAGSSSFGRNPYENGLPVAVNIALQAASFVYTAYLYGGIYLMAVKQVRRERVEIADLFRGGPLLGKMLGFHFIYIVATLLGTALCILPGLLLSGLLYPAYALIADGESVTGAISRSVDAMKRDMWNAAAFYFVMGLLVVVSFFAFCLGEFITTPMLWLTAALAYRDMIGMPGVAAPNPYGTLPPQYGQPQQPGVWPPPPGMGQAPPSFGPPLGGGDTFDVRGPRPRRT